MGSVSGLVKVNCLVWEIEKPLRDSARRSSNFSLLGCEWNFRMEERRSEFTISLWKVTNEDPPTAGFTLTTYISGKRANTCLWEAKKFISTTEIVFKCSSDPDDRECWSNVHGGKFTVFFTFRSDQPLILHLSRSETDLSEDNSVHESPPDLERLSADFRQLLKDDTFTDVKLTCGDLSISAHRSILAIRSEVFAAMFRNKMTESETGTVDIRDMDYEVLDLLLQYVY